MKSNNFLINMNKYKKKILNYKRYYKNNQFNFKKNI